MNKEFECTTCGQIHSEFPMTFGAAAPFSWYEIPQEDRARRAVLSSDQCIIDEKHFFVLGRLLIPIKNERDVFSWLVWVSLSAEKFERMDALWDSAGRESEPPYFGWLNTRLPAYPDTLNLKCNVITQPLGQRPLVDVEPTSHPLAVEQREGVGAIRLRAIAEAALHPVPTK